MLWRKIFDHNPIFTTFCDKLATKAYMQRICPDLAIPVTLWHGKNPQSINNGLLQNPFVIKANHACNRNLLLCSEMNQLPFEKLEQWRKEVYGSIQLEWGYQNSRRLLFVEKWLSKAGDPPLLDLSVHSFDGKPGFIEAIVNHKSPNKRKGYFHIDGSRWKNLEKNGGNNSYSLDDNYRLPEIYHDAIRHAIQLSDSIDYARYDFMFTGECLYGGEITVYPGSGLNKASDFSAYNKEIIIHWNIQKSWFCSTSHSGLLGIYSRVLNQWLQKMALST
jgi:hypothetical protein